MSGSHASHVLVYGSLASHGSHVLYTQIRKCLVTRSSQRLLVRPQRIGDSRTKPIGPDALQLISSQSNCFLVQQADQIGPGASRSLSLG